MSTIAIPKRTLGKDVIRTDFDPSEYDKNIRAYGYRAIWQAAEECPCRLGAKTENPDPSCKACKGDGFLYVYPDPGEPTLADYFKVEPPFLDTANGRATQALITSMTNDTEMFEKLGQWLLGTARLTSFTWNTVAFRDRFTLVDSTMPFKQVVTLAADRIVRVGKAKNEIRYPAIKVLHVFAVNPKTGVITDFTPFVDVTSDGDVDLTLASAAAPGALVSIRYTMNPVWVVIDHPYAIRDTLTKKKNKNVLGEHLKLPVACMVKLDFLVDPGA